MKLNCDIAEVIRQDFNALWTCKQRGETLEISTPYLMPDSTLLSVFLTIRGERFIVCDGGGVVEALSENCSTPESEWTESLEDMARKFRMKTGNLDGRPLYFKDCNDPKLISSLVFDVANFATMSVAALITEEPRKRRPNEVP